MGEVWLGVDDPWPDRPHQEWPITLEQARRAGWLLRKVSAHGYGLIVCKRSSGDAGRDFCTVTAAVAGTGASVLIGVGQATNRHAASYVRAWVEAAAEACQGRVRLLGFWSCTTRSARRMDAHV